MKELLRRVCPDALAVLLFVLLSAAYFVTPLTQGLVLTGHDVTGGDGAGHERQEYVERTGGEQTWWTNALFGGMPTYQIAPDYPSRHALSSLERVYSLGLSDCTMYVFILLLGGYVCMRAFGKDPAMSVLGAVIWAFSSYFFIILGAGHFWKALTLAFIPPTVAGMVMCYRGKYLWGGVLSALFIAWQILSNHLQMTYYFLFVLFFLSIGFFVQALKEGTMARFLKGLAVFSIAGMIGLAANGSNLYHTYQYSKQTMRGQSELSSAGNAGESRASSGLSHEYITQWSYGIGETWTLLVPSVKGGASGALFENEKVQGNGHFESYNNTLRQLYPQLQGSTPGLSAYWGDQPGTAGPVYVGAFICFLFVLGLFIVPGAVKWMLLLLTLFSITLSWGHNFMPLTAFFIDHFPMYNKFRAVSSILVIAEFTMPLLAILALSRLIKEPGLLLRRKTAVCVSLALTGGVALLFALVPSALGPCLTAREVETFASLAQFVDASTLAQYRGDIIALRESVFSSDAWRSLLFIVLGFILLWIYARGKMRTMWLMVSLLLLCLVDMWQVNKRYLNDGMFVEPMEKEQVFAKSAADEQILQDKALDYRVLNFAGDTFNENETSYWHKSIGGYHAAKLGRYQDLINHCITPEMRKLLSSLSQTGGDASLLQDTVSPVLNMLNTRYFILPSSSGGKVALRNVNALGNAWLASSLTYVKGAPAEMKALQSLSSPKNVVGDASFEQILGPAFAEASYDSASSVILKAYEPNRLDYETHAAKDGVAVFSEIYYPGWKATLDGKPMEIGRVNYLLRAVKVPAGNHQIILSFEPSSLSATETVAYIAVFLLLLALLGALAWTLWSFLHPSIKNDK